MTNLLLVDSWVIAAPIIAAQYVLAVIGLIVLSKRDTSTKAYVLWNIFILLVFFLGSIAFLIYNKARPRKKK